MCVFKGLSIDGHELGEDVLWMLNYFRPIKVLRNFIFSHFYPVWFYFFQKVVCKEFKSHQPDPGTKQNIFHVLNLIKYFERIQVLLLEKLLENNKSEVVMVVIHFLSGIVPIAEMARFTPYLLKLLAICLSTLLDSGHPPSSNSIFSVSSATCFSRSSSVVLAFSCHFKI